MREQGGISVVIVTRNRAAALERVALPALARQTRPPLEVLVWDSSDDEAGREAVARCARAFPHLAVRWERAGRRGSASQRNDSLAAVRGEVVLFLDDDAALSEDGLEALAEAFTDPAVAGAGLDIRLTEEAAAVHRARSGWERLLRRLFLLPCPGPRPVCQASGWNRYTLGAYTGEVQWLCSCCAAFRREHLGAAPFEESLERFGGYAYAEDLLFSQKLWRSGCTLVVAPRGGVFHDQEPGGRLESSGFWAARLYNGFVLWREGVFPYAPWTFPAYLWSACGFALFLLLSAAATRDRARLAGLARGGWAIASDLWTGRGRA